MTGGPSRLAWPWTLRFPIAGAALLAALPLLADGLGRRLGLGSGAAGVFRLRGEESLAAGALAVGLAWSLVTTAELLLRLAPLRAGPPPLGTAALRRWSRARPWLLAALVLPLATRLLTAPEPAQREASGAALLAGMALALGIGLGLWRLADLQGAPAEARAPAPASRWAPGYRPARAHLAAALALGLWAAAYAGVGLAFRPALAPLGCRDLVVQVCFPTLGYLLLVGTALAWLLPGASFLLDRWRFPSLLTLGLLWLSALLLFDEGHGFGLRAAEAPPPPPTADEAMLAWLRPSGACGDLAGGEPPPLIVVAAAGGGIKAALWTTTVLGGLELEHGAAWRRSLQAVSAVSGGSLGTVAYLWGLEPAAGSPPRPAAELAAVRGALAGGSLRPAFWGLAYPDLWRGPAALAGWLGRRAGRPELAGLTRVDRAWALERSWAHRLAELAPGAQPPTVRGWAPAVREGCRAVPLINAMAVESGTPLVFSPVRLLSGGAGAPRSLPDAIELQSLPPAGEAEAAAPGPAGQAFTGSAGFLDSYPEHDVDWVTAARLSASFPWITPAARAVDDAGPVPGDTRLGTFFSDGGYFDNYGVVTLVQWLGAVLPAYADAGGRRVLVISIYGRDCPSGDCPAGKPSGAAALPGLRGLGAGPISALISARGATQKVRNLQALELLVGAWAGRLRIETAEFALDADLPLSWELSPRELERLEAAWRDDEGPRGGREAVGRFLGGAGH